MEIFDCYIEFNRVESSKRIALTKEGYLSKDREVCLENADTLKLNKELLND